MEGHKLMKSAITSYGIWIMSSMWRRKYPVLCIVVIILVLTFCIQYSITREIIEVKIRPEQLANTNMEKQKHTLNDDVQFVSKSLAEEDASVKDMKSNEIEHRTKMPFIPAKRIIHLDLKGAPPKLGYIDEFFGMVKSLGATGILLEWEDTFPWKGNLSRIAAGNAYSDNDVVDILSFAKKHNLEIIPLIQTFGHVEFALKYSEFAHLREVPESPQSLCPSLNDSMQFVRDMIDQVMLVHSESEYLHIGCDEVFNLAECSRCRKKMRDDLFLSHVSEVATYVRKKYPSVIPIIWDDMLRHLPIITLQSYQIGNLVEPMVWVYAEDVYRFVPPTIWDKYTSIFSHAWTASAFKGAFGESFYVPNVKRHLDNNMNWMQVMAAEQDKFKKGFRGIVITGWQRYDHFAVLCELLPAAIPSLTVTLLAVNNGYTSYNQTLKNQIHEGLKCGLVSESSRAAGFTFENDPFLWDHFSRCSFLSNQFFRFLYRFHVIEHDVNEFLQFSKKNKGWMTEYNARRNFSSPLRVDELMLDESRIYSSLLSLIPALQVALQDIFDIHTIAEWTEQKIYPLILQIEESQKLATVLKIPKVWPKRPFPLLNDLQRIGIVFPNNNASKTDFL